MDTQLLTAIIGGCSMIIVVLFQHILALKDKKRRIKAIKERDQKLKEYQDKYIKLLDERSDQRKRKISDQLQILEEKIADLFVSGQTPEVSILGINALGPLHQGLEIFRLFLHKGGALRILLLNPKEVTFDKRSELEHDEVGRLRAELLASFHIIMDLMKKMPPGKIEVRLHAEYPDRSLFMINSEKEDGIVMENPYPKLQATRGVAGQMYTLVRHGRTWPGYRDALEYFSKLWGRADEIEVVQQKRNQIQEWPFVLKSLRRA